MLVFHIHDLLMKKLLRTSIYVFTERMILKKIILGFIDFYLNISSCTFSKKNNMSLTGKKKHLWLNSGALTPLV